MVTTREALLPFVDTVTVDTPFDCVSAFVGTARTLSTVRYVITADALAPTWNPEGVPFNEITTGKVATPELVDAIVPTDVTDPVADAAVGAAGVAPVDDPFVPVGAPPVARAPPTPPPGKPPPPKPPRAAPLVLLDELVGVTVAD